MSRGSARKRAAKGQREGRKEKKKEKRWCSQLPQLQQKTVVLSVCISFLFPPLTLSVGKLEKSSPPWRRASSLPYSSVVFGWGSVLSLLYTFDRLAMAASAVPPQPARASRTGLFKSFPFFKNRVETKKLFSKKKKESSREISLKTFQKLKKSAKFEKHFSKKGGGWGPMG